MCTVRSLCSRTKHPIPGQSPPERPAPTFWRRQEHSIISELLSCLMTKVQPRAAQFLDYLTTASSSLFPLFGIILVTLDVSLRASVWGVLGHLCLVLVKPKSFFF